MPIEAMATAHPSSQNGLILVKTTPAQWREIQEYHAHLWGCGVSLEDYQQRKTLLCVDSEFSKKGNFTGWALVPKDDPETLEGLASFCDTYERPVFVKNETHPDGKELKCTCIVSVFTPEAHRGKGYARHMLTLLHEEMAKNSIMSILYSDIGDYYSTVKRKHPDPTKQIGWETISPLHTVWTVDEDLPKQVPESAQSRFTKLEESEIGTVCEHDALLLKTKVQACERPAFTVVPTTDQIDWQLRRTRFFDDLRHPSSRYKYPKLDDWGCQQGQPGDEDWAFAIWHYDVIVNELNILRLRCNTPEQLLAILQRAQQAAAKQGMKSITAWNVDEKLLGGTGWKNVKRQDHLSAVAWYGEGELPRWICNEVSVNSLPRGVKIADVFP